MHPSLERIITRIFKFFSSIQLAVVTLLGLGVISAVGTIVEAKYDAQYAQKIVYHSAWMYLFLGLLIVNLVNVMIDRWPWKQHHSAFVSAHIGIIILILGSAITRVWGIDGSMAIDIGSKNRFVLMPETEFMVYAHLGEGDYKPIHQKQMDLLIKPPSEHDYVLSLGSNDLQIVDYYHFAMAEEVMLEDKDPNAGPAIRFQLQNDNVNMTQWVFKDWRKPEASLDLGPAKISIVDKKPKFNNANEVVFRRLKNDALEYYVFTKRVGGLSKKGKIKPGEVTDLGWMGLQLRMLKYIPRARRLIKYTPLESPNAVSTSALRFRFQEEEYTIGLNSSVRVFTDDVAYIIGYYNVRRDLGFEVQLEDFSVRRYQGSMKAMSYESNVNVPGLGKRRIYMNNPLKHNGYTLYQASFQEDEMGRPIASILSINKDPGRWVKYFGSFLIVLGTILLFYFRRLGRKNKPARSAA